MAKIKKPSSIFRERLSFFVYGITQRNYCAFLVVSAGVVAVVSATTGAGVSVTGAAVAVESAGVSVVVAAPPQAVKKAKEITTKANFNVDFIILECLNIK